MDDPAPREKKRQRLRAPQPASPRTDLGQSAQAVDVALRNAHSQDLVGRIWKKDFTVWRSMPKEITNRLGWLTVTDLMREKLSVLKSFAEEVRQAGFRSVALLGMGGSSLGPEVLRQAFGSAPGYPVLKVLDTTVPAWIRAVSEEIDPARTLFLVSSKSGTTIESNALYAYFRALMERAVGPEQAGQHFVAITDHGTPLEALANHEGFRHIFLNPPDIGGRYSVLSYFGLVPAALIGLDLEALLDRADDMGGGCAASTRGYQNPGLWLGCIMGAMALQSKDKLTLVTSRSIESFGLWVEQLLAESTGKEGKGIVPVAQEPLGAPAHYGGDRLFVYLRVEGDDNGKTDAALERIRASGQPLLRLDLRDRHDLGAEFFRWQFATAVAGSMLGIHPFDQPDVQQAKDSAESLLVRYQAAGSFPNPRPTPSFRELLGQAKAGDYLALMVYAQPTPDLEAALAHLRAVVMERYHIATTFGYGPRYLHSTGQLHKGGPDTGLFLQIIPPIGPDVAIPGKSYTFGVLMQAQALGDLMTLQERGRRVAQLVLTEDVVHDIEGLTAHLSA